MSPLNVQFLYIRREHFGSFAGIQRLIAYIDRQRVSARIRAVQDGDDDLDVKFPVRSPLVRGLLRYATQRRGQQWYNLSDLAAECALLRPWTAGHIDILHYLDGEHTAQYLPAFPMMFRRRGRAIGTYHQPASVLPQVVVPAVVKRLDHVTVVASSQLEYFARILPETRLSRLYHGVDTEFFAPRDDVKTGDIFRCLIVGSYLRDWNLLGEVAKLLAGRREIELHVVSSSAPSFEWLGNIVVHRNVDDHSLRDLYGQADLLVLPLSDGTANNALLEGMAMRLPVLASDLPSVREYASSDAAMYLPNDPHSFAESILWLMDDRGRRMAMGAAARARAEALAWPIVARAYENLYERLA